MKILFDIVHPAYVHLFKECINRLIQRGDKVLVASRRKDLTLSLLNSLGIDHVQLSSKLRGASGLFVEMCVRNFQLFKAARRFKPDLFVGTNMCAAFIAWVLRKKSLLFDDTEIDRVNWSLYYPFVTEVHSASCFRFRLGKKHHFYEGYHSLAYLHPNYFQFDLDKIKKAGINQQEKIVLIRFVDWVATHDIGMTGLTAKSKDKIIRALSPYGKILISSEGPLPKRLECYRLDMPVEDIHHLLSFARLFIGESATMSSEAAVLGTPAIYIDSQGRGYIDEQSKRYGSCNMYKPYETDKILKKAIELLSIDDINQRFAASHKRMLAEKIDVSLYQIKQIDRLLDENT